jgi:fused signal recognition particle receptor
MNLEETLIEADFGVGLAQELVESIRKDGAKADDVLSTLQNRIEDILKSSDAGSTLAVSTDPGNLTVYMVVGVNGVGKTTTIAKLAHHLKGNGHRVILAAGDTFRAGAIEQIEIWGERVGVDVISQKAGANPSAVIFDAIDAAIARKAEFLICDTSGRLHTQKELMDELSKMKRTISRKVEGAPHEILLVLDATTGQNAIIQASTFREYLDVTGAILVKLDGTAKGGTVVATAHEFGLPVKFVGLGETLDDLVPFDVPQFVKGLLS